MRDGETSITVQARAAREHDEILRMEAGERFDKYLLAGAGGGIYFATALFKYAIHDVICARVLLFSGVLSLLIAVAAIFENASLLYVTYTLRRDQIDRLIAKRPELQDANQSEDKVTEKISSNGKRIEFYNRVGRVCLYLGAALLETISKRHIDAGGDTTIIRRPIE